MQLLGSFRLAMKEVSFLPGERIIKEGDDGDCHCWNCLWFHVTFLASSASCVSFWFLWSWESRTFSVWSKKAIRNARSWSTERRRRLCLGLGSSPVLAPTYAHRKMIAEKACLQVGSIWEADSWMDNHLFQKKPKISHRYASVLWPDFSTHLTHHRYYVLVPGFLLPFSAAVEYVLCVWFFLSSNAASMCVQRRFCP